MIPASRPSNTTNPVVVVIDHDRETRDFIARLVSSVGLKAELYVSPTDLFCAGRPDAPSCLVMEFRLTLMNGLEVQSRLRQLHIDLPVLFVSGYGDVETAVRAMKAGAIDFLPKPIREQDLLDAIHAALEQDKRARATRAETSKVIRLFASLTPREQEVMQHVVAGLMNKQIAYRMDLSEITVKVHRGHVMRKMNAKSLPELVCMARTLFGTLGQDPSLPQPPWAGWAVPLPASVADPFLGYAA